MGRLTNLVYTGIEVCRESKVPVLFVSNPGYGKTTLVKKWAETNNYHVETIIGSSFAKEEVQGYQVNTGKKHLEFLEPYWYTRIMNEHKVGRPTILFIDELSTAPSEVQGSLFRLIFDRCIGNGDLLPEDTLIISAANYKENLPDYFEITAPALNRFCVINLLPRSPQEVVQEFLSPIDDVPEYTRMEQSEEERTQIRQKLQQELCSLIVTYPEESFDSRNKSFHDVYSDSPDNQKRVLNFMSGRTISYLAEVIIAIRTLSLKIGNPYIDEALDGLVGLGTNNFASEKEHAAYLQSLHKVMKGVIFDLAKREFTADELMDKSVSEIITEMHQLADGLELTEKSATLFCQVMSTKLNDYARNISRMVSTNRDFLWSEAKAAQMLTQIANKIHLRDTVSLTAVKTIADVLLSLLGEKKGKNADFSLVRIIDERGSICETVLQRQNRVFTTCALTSGIRPVNHYDLFERVVSVYDGRCWMPLQKYLMAV